MPTTNCRCHDRAMPSPGGAIRRHATGASRRGAVLVEFAVVIILLLLLFCGIVEFGVFYFKGLAFSQAAREGARAAAKGSLPDKIVARAKNLVAGTVDPTQVTVTLAYSSDFGATFPNAVGINHLGNANNVPRGDLVRVTLSAWHPLLMGTMFSFLPGVQNNSLPLDARVAMRRQ